MKKQREERRAQSEIINRVNQLNWAARRKGMTIRDFCVKQAEIADSTVIMAIERIVAGAKRRAERSRLFADHAGRAAIRLVDDAVEAVRAEIGQCKADKIAKRHPRHGQHRPSAARYVGQAA